MKRFHELTEEQQEQAIEFAKDMLRNLVLEGVVQSDRQLTPAHVQEIAESAAEDAWYSERTDQVIADIADGK